MTLCSPVYALQDFHSGYQPRAQPNQSEQRLQPQVVTSSDLTPEPLYFQVTLFITIVPYKT